MSDEIRLAFAHPLARAEALAGDAPRDRISLRDHVVEVEIGAFQAERDQTQRLSFNVVVEVAPPGAEVDDDVDRILSYDRVTEAIATELAAERLNLLETLAERVAARILSEPQAMKVFLRIEKLDRGPGALGVEIVRSGRGPQSPTESPATPAPLIVYLAPEAVCSPHLSAWLDQLSQRGQPFLLCVGLPMGAIPPAGEARAQRHIDLLAIEQHAWVLAARDPRIAVVGSRTELDWAAKNAQIAVWAPARIVLDTVEGPEAPLNDGAGLALWFAKTVAASGLLVIGATPPEGAELPTRQSAADNAELPT